MEDVQNNSFEAVEVPVDILVEVFNNGTVKICGRQPLKNFIWSIFEYFVTFVTSTEQVVILLGQEKLASNRPNIQKMSFHKRLKFFSEMCPQYMNLTYKASNQNKIVTGNSSLKFFQLVRTKTMTQKYVCRI